MHGAEYRAGKLDEATHGRRIESEMHWICNISGRNATAYKSRDRSTAWTTRQAQRRVRCCGAKAPP